MSGYFNELRTAQRTVRICVLLAIVFVALGINELSSEQTSAFGRGTGGMLREFLNTYFGVAGLCVFWIVPALGLLIFARSIWRHTPRTPNDRWYRN